MIQHERLRSLMSEKGVKQKALAEKIGISPQAVSKIVKGETTDPRKLLAIAQALDVSVEYLQGDADTPDPNGASESVSAQDRALLTQFHKLSFTSREAIMEIMRVMASATEQYADSGRACDILDPSCGSADFRQAKRVATKRKSRSQRVLG